MDKYNEYKIKQINQNTWFENQARGVFNKAVPFVLDKFKPYLNQKVIKQDFRILKKIEDEIKPFLDEVKNTTEIKPYENEIAKISYIYLRVDTYSIILRLGLSFGSVYYETDKYVCSIRDFILEKLYDFEELKFIDVNKEIEIYNKAEEYKTLFEAEIDKFSFWKNRGLLK